VTGVCRTSNVVMLRSIGADHVLDYTQVDFTRGGRKYDLIFDCVSNHSLTEYRRVLRPKGVLVMAGDQTGRGALEIVGRLTGALLFSKLTSQTFVTFIAKPKRTQFGISSRNMLAEKL
jgi:NADPH:quinone reductase-like Zn-dependent oxidoreductase